MACDNDRVHNRAAMWLVSFFMKKAVPAITERLFLKPRPSHGSFIEGMLTSFVQVVNNLWRLFAADDIITEANTEIVSLTQTTNMLPLLYADTR